MTCTSCGSENEAGRKFCSECGASLSVLCPACGAPNPPRAKFCGDCGGALVGAGAPGLAASQPAGVASSNGSATAAAGASPVPAPVTERRLVSVLFADLVGFTALAEGRDSEEVRELLSRYFDRCQTVVERYGGVVEKFIGDAVMAVWGTPVANEDDAERAVRAALELVDDIARLGGEVGAAELRARAGVLTGEATVNLGATGQSMVAGDLVNTASRLQSTAEPGSVVVGDTTKRATDASITYTDAGTHLLKGKAEPMRIWQAHRVVAGVRGLMKSEGLEAPFVGRDRELKLVKDLFHACADEAKAHVIQVTGIAGIGKSRLGWEFFKYMDGLRQLFWWHRGRCLAYGEGVTYWALAEMVRGRAEITEGEDRSSAVTKLHDAVEKYVPDDAERRFVEPRLAHLLGLEDRTASDKGDLFAGWRLFFERLATTNPVVMVFEDLQWADPSLLEFIDHLLEWSRAFPIFVLTLARPGGDAPLARARRNATSMYLEPLAEQAMEQLLTGLAPGLPTELKAKILARAEGVPLYAVETVRMLLDRGLLVREGSAYRPTGPVQDLEVPETLHALIAARLDGLSLSERRLVQDASVLGKTCSRAALAAVSGLSEDDLEPLLASLLAREVLSVQADPRSPERGQYGFLQDLVRTVAYETLSHKDRKAKHLEVADYLEGAWGSDEDEIVGVMASHLTEAYRLAPDAEDAGPIRDKARGMLVRAGERAASLAAAEEAGAYYARAAELANSEEERARLVERCGEMLLLRGHLGSAGERFEEAMALFDSVGLSHPAARVQARLAEVAMLENHLEKGLEATRHAYQVMAGDEPDRDLAIVSGQFGRFLALAGHDAEALPVLEEALRLAEHQQLWEVYSHALSSRAVIIHRQARFDEAVTLLRRALEVALDNDFSAAAQRAWNNLAVTLESQDRFLETQELMAPSLELARRKGDRTRELSALVGFVSSMVPVGQWDEALAQVEEAVAYEELASLRWVAVGMLAIVPVHVRRGDLDAARQVVETYSGSGDEDNPGVRAGMIDVTAEYLRAVGKPTEALALAEEVLPLIPVLGLPALGVKNSLVQAMEAALDLGDVDRADSLLGIVRQSVPGMVPPYLRAHAARFEARIAALRSEDATVHAQFEWAVQGFRQIPMPFDAAVSLLELGEWLAGKGRHRDAEPVLSEAREIFQRLRARPWLERLALVSELPAPTLAAGTEG